MLRFIIAFLVALVAISVAASAQFNQPLLSSGGVPVHIISTKILAVSFCSNNNCTFNPGTTNAVGQATVQLSNNGTFSGSFNMPVSGTATNPAGAACPNNSADFTISSAGVLSSTAASANQNYSVCIAASQPGAGPPNPYIQLVSLAPSASVACDYGPNAAVPPPAAGAGFNHCFLNADFTDNSGSTTGGGWIMNTPSTWAGNCVSSPANTAYMYLTGMTSDSSPQVKTAMPCNRIVFITDGSNGRVLDVQWQTSDFTNYTANFLSLTFPTATDGIGCVGPGCPAGGPNKTGLSAPMYAELEFKTPAGSWTSLGGFNNGNNVYDFWRDACNCGGTPASFVEVDFFELFVGAGCPTTCGRGPTINGTIKGGASSAAGTTLPTLDYTSYHTIGNLLTDSGSNAGLCVFVDGGVASNTASSCGNGSSGSVASDHGVLSVWVGSQCETNPATVCSTNNIDAYIMHVRLFQCANAWNASCSSTVRTSEAETGRKSMFAQLWDLLLPSAHAEPFDRPSMGFWVCPDGSEDHTGARCKPEEFKWGRDGNHWWEACMPERDDCVWSDTAFLGWDGIIAKPRGPGYCYSKQPFTCSPDGKWPK